jgi:hypothetical protein
MSIEFKELIRIGSRQNCVIWESLEEKDPTDIPYIYFQFSNVLDPLSDRVRKCLFFLMMSTCEENNMWELSRALVHTAACILALIETLKH